MRRAACVFRPRHQEFCGNLSEMNDVFVDAHGVVLQCVMLMAGRKSECDQLATALLLQRVDLSGAR